MNANQQFRQMLHSNLSVEVYRVENSTVKLGITHKQGTIFLDNDTKTLYLSKINTLPFHTLGGLLLDNKLITFAGNTTANDTMFKSVYDTDDSSVVDASESLTITTGTITGDEILALIISSGGVKTGVEALVMDVAEPVTFDIPFSDTNYSLVVNCTDSNGWQVGYIITNRTALGFTIEASANCIYNYLAASYTPAP